jgi:hypothetical protein
MLQYASIASIYNRDEAHRVCRYWLYPGNSVKAPIDTGQRITHSFNRLQPELQRIEESVHVLAQY